MTPCQQVKASAANGPLRVGQYTPQCNDDGSYSEMQCHGSTGYCWCVDQDGVKRKDTEVGPGRGKPNCQPPPPVGSSTEAGWLTIRFENIFREDFDLSKERAHYRDSVVLNAIQNSSLKSLLEKNLRESNKNLDLEDTTLNKSNFFVSYFKLVLPFRSLSIWSLLFIWYS